MKLTVLGKYGPYAPAHGATSGYLLENEGNHVLLDMGVQLRIEKDKIIQKAPKKLESIHIVRTMPYPGFPTDMQAPMMALALSLRGTSVFLETIFENRFMHAREMVRMGASIRIEDRIALVSGGHPLGGTSVTSTDLRGGAALMLCGLLAEGETTLHDPNGQIARGYEDLPGMLRTLGASVEEE